jgi:hypothetical protein
MLFQFVRADQTVQPMNPYTNTPIAMADGTMSRIETMRSRVTRRRRPRALTRSAAAEAACSELLVNTRVDGRLNQRLLRRFSASLGVLTALRVASAYT